MLINKAIETAAKAHDGQYDKGGEPYIYHPLRVMLYANGDEVRRSFARCNRRYKNYRT